MVSVIIPVYNIEAYLSSCIDSVLNQTYRNIQIILIDDGSKDRSGEICDEYQKKDSRIEVIHKENGGVSSARNIGLKKAKGEYICFVDGDDELRTNMIEILVKSIKEYSTDLCICSYYIKTLLKDLKKDVDKFVLDNFFKDSDYFFYLYKNNLLNPLWNKLFKKELIKEEFNENFSMGEDLIFVLKYLNNIKSLCLIDQCLYIYKIRAGSATSTFQPKRINTIIELHSEIIQFCKKFNNFSLEEKFLLANIKELDIAFESLIMNFKEKEVVISYLKNWCSSYKLKKFIEKNNLYNRNPFDLMIERKYEDLYVYYSKKTFFKRVKKNIKKIIYFIVKK